MISPKPDQTRAARLLDPLPTGENMPPDIYAKLAKHLDNLPGGFPSTSTGVELRILRRLFSREEAELALCAGLIPEGAAVVAKRAGIGPKEAGEKLDRLAAKGLIFSIVREGRPTLYMAAQYVIGIWEYHLNDLDEDLIRDMNEYIPHLFTPEVWTKGPQLRTIPVERSLTPGHPIMPHEQARELVKDQKKFLVAPCICRREHEIIGEGCDKPLESCLIFGWGADYYRRNGLGREIDLAETLDILTMADEAGLVLQPSNAQKIVNICTCCGCCCQVLKSFKRHPAPARIVAAAYVAEFEAETCVGCGVCVDRCQMEALEMVEGEIVFKPERCIGCGLCVTTCATGSLNLKRRPDEEQKEVPRNMYEAGKKLARARGKLNPVKETYLGLKSKMDRLRVKS